MSYRVTKLQSIFPPCILRIAGFGFFAPAAPDIRGNGQKVKICATGAPSAPRWRAVELILYLPAPAPAAGMFCPALVCARKGTKSATVVARW